MQRRLVPGHTLNCHGDPSYQSSLVANHKIALSFNPKPILIHIKNNADFLTEDVVEQIHNAGAKIFLSALNAIDQGADNSDDAAPYLERYSLGVDVLQTDYPHWLLQGLKRLLPQN